MGASNPTYAELDCGQRTPKLEFYIRVQSAALSNVNPYVQRV